MPISSVSTQITKWKMSHDQIDQQKYLPQQTGKLFEMQRKPTDDISWNTGLPVGCTVESLEESHCYANATNNHAYNTPNNRGQTSILLEQNHSEWWDPNWIFGHNNKWYIWRGVNQTYKERYTIPTMKHRGGSLMFWWCVSYKCTGNLVKIDGKMNGICYQKVREKNLHLSAWKLRMGPTCIFQHDNDPKQRAKSTCRFQH